MGEGTHTPVFSLFPFIRVVRFPFSLIPQSANAFIYYKDLRIRPSHKHQILQDWGEGPTHHVAYILGKHPIGMHAKDYKKTFHEGLGVDHEEWKKAKEQERQQK